MHLRGDLEKQLTQEIVTYEEARNMPYITSVERFAEARGRASVVLSLLAEVCGDLPEDSAARVQQLSSPALEKLAKALLRFQSLGDLQRWLERFEASNE